MKGRKFARRGSGGELDRNHRLSMRRARGAWGSSTHSLGPANNFRAGQLLLSKRTPMATSPASKIDVRHWRECYKRASAASMQTAVNGSEARVRSDPVHHFPLERESNLYPKVKSH